MGCCLSPAEKKTESQTPERVQLGAGSQDSPDHASVLQRARQREEELQQRARQREEELQQSARQREEELETRIAELQVAAVASNAVATDPDIPAAKPPLEALRKELVELRKNRETIELERSIERGEKEELAQRLLAIEMDAAEFREKSRLKLESVTAEKERLETSLEQAVAILWEDRGKPLDKLSHERERVTELQTGLVDVLIQRDQAERAAASAYDLLGRREKDEAGLKDVLIQRDQAERAAESSFKLQEKAEARLADALIQRDQAERAAESVHDLQKKAEPKEVSSLRRLSLILQEDEEDEKGRRLGGESTPSPAQLTKTVEELRAEISHLSLALERAEASCASRQDATVGEVQIQRDQAERVAESVHELLEKSEAGLAQALIQRDQAERAAANADDLQEKAEARLADALIQREGEQEQRRREEMRRREEERRLPEESAEDSTSAEEELAGEAGDRIKEMKALLKSGDTERIIFFTNHSRQKEIYILAANHLQTLDWHSPDKPQLMKNIIGFYQKARAWESLAGFYDAMSQVDIDEYRDYKKALEGLREAATYLEKSQAMNKAQKIAALDLRIQYVGQFVEAQAKVPTDPQKMVELCNQLLEKEDVEGSVRVGDVFALLVEFYVLRKDNRKAYELVEKMRERHIIVKYYLESQLIQQVYKAMGVEYREQEAQPPDDDDAE